MGHGDFRLSVKRSWKVFVRKSDLMFYVHSFATPSTPAITAACRKNSQSKEWKKTVVVAHALDF